MKIRTWFWQRSGSSEARASVVDCAAWLSSGGHVGRGHHSYETYIPPYRNVLEYHGRSFLSRHSNAVGAQECSPARERWARVRLRAGLDSFAPPALNAAGITWKVAAAAFHIDR